MVLDELMQLSNGSDPTTDAVTDRNQHNTVLIRCDMIMFFSFLFIAYSLVSAQGNFFESKLVGGVEYGLRCDVVSCQKHESDEGKGSSTSKTYFGLWAPSHTTNRPQTRVNAAYSQSYLLTHI